MKFDAEKGRIGGRRGKGPDKRNHRKKRDKNQNKFAHGPSGMPHYSIVPFYFSIIY
jgi:hypothetical protein